MDTYRGAKDLIDEMQQDQIFIGMIAMRQLPRFEVEGAIKTIRKTGTHFTFFTADGPRPSKLFAERLGLETVSDCPRTSSSTRSYSVPPTRDAEREEKRGKNRRALPPQKR
jgi:magnesium-transporting ATPase (P-type)